MKPFIQIILASLAMHSSIPEVTATLVLFLLLIFAIKPKGIKR